MLLTYAIAFGMIVGLCKSSLIRYILGQKTYIEPKEPNMVTYLFLYNNHNE